ncbi:MAG: rRNA pseudouridine synthase [Bacteroidetes bacterium]|nr:rRNA pseudouridine synthase [Bacteroidota bacterium]
MSTNKVPQSNGETPSASSDGLFRLNKFLSNAGVASRRKSDELIKSGKVKVNGKVITEVGSKVTIKDKVEYDGKRIFPGKKVYILVNKPKDVICTTVDERGRRTIMDMIKGATTERVYPVGRLDRQTTGLILLTNDGDLSQKLTHPSKKVSKLYKVELNKPLTKADFKKVLLGVKLEEGFAVVDELAYTDKTHRIVGLELHIGWNRVIRRIFETLGYDVVKLDRVIFAGLTKKDLPRGRWRILNPKEVVKLKHFTPLN